jgi:pimeloyl-ACP methyl ester carboxylesterase
MPEELKPDRRRFVGTALLATAAAYLIPACSNRPSNDVTPLPEPPPALVAAAFGALKQVDAGLLSVGYVEAGPEDGTTVLLLHGWPYDIHSFVEVVPLLAAAGYRVIVPHLRGHGTTRFLSNDAVRNGQQSAVALDIITLMDALHIERAILGGFDWGARTADIIAALWPERCLGLVSVNGYLINDLKRNEQPLTPEAEHGWWYQFYFATERGRRGYEAHPRDFARLMWRLNSPKWSFDEATFELSAASLDNPDHTRLVIHNYRWRLSVAAGEPRYDELEARLAAGPVVSTPTITLDGAADGVAPATDGSAYASKFSGARLHRIVPGAGHNLPREAPRAFADAIIDVDGLQ